MSQRDNGLAERDESTDSHWSEPLGVGRRDFLIASVGAATLAAVGSSEVAGQESDRYYRKTQPTVWTEEDRRNARENIEEFGWAEDERDSYVEDAETILEYWEYDDLWRFVPSQLVPRGNSLRPAVTYPTSTDWDWDRMSSGFLGYATAPSFDWELSNTVEIDSEEREIRIPTNDYAAYRESGRNEEGVFDPDLADDQHLENTKHPELGESWGVDDGTGFVDDEGHIGEVGWEWLPVSWLNHWAVIYALRQFVYRLSTAYIYTGEQRYARPAAIILDRAGDVYPELNHRNLYEHYGKTFSNSTGGTQQGRFVGAIWESSQIREWLWSYDRVFPGMDDNDLVAFLDGKQSEYPDLAPKNSVGAIRENIETGFIHEMLPAFEMAQIRGNFGFHQSTLAVSAVVADDPEGYTGEAIDYAFQPGTLRSPSETDTDRWETTGGDILGFLVGSPQSGYIVDEDGYPNESAAHYNTSQQNSIHTFAEAVRGYDGYDEADLYENVKFKQVVDSHWQLTMLGKYTPQIANTHGVGSPKAIGSPPEASGLTVDTANDTETAFDTIDEEEYRDTELAEWIHMLEEQTGSDLTDEEIEALTDEVAALREDPDMLDEDPDEARANAETADEPVPTSTRDVSTSQVGTAISSYNRTIQSPEIALDGFEEYHTPELAQWAYMLNGLSSDGLSGGIFDADPEALQNDVEDVIDEYGPVIDLDSTQAAGYGFSALRDGDGDHQRGVYQYYGRNTFGTGSSHTHRDTHNLGVYGYDLDLSPELGRQGSDWEGNDLGSWVESTFAHNTVVVDEANTEGQWVGYPRHFDHTEEVQLMDIESEHAYPQTDRHRRTTAMIHADDESSYVIDFFRVRGGSDHHFSFHGMTSFGVATEGLDLDAQNGGTYTGEDVGFGEGGPMSYLYNIERDDDPEVGFSVDWDIEDYWQVRDDGGEPVHLRLTMLTEIDELALATGRPAEQSTENNPRELPFMLAHRSGEDLDSTFVSVIEPYENNRVVASIEEVSVESDNEEVDLDAVRAVKIELQDGRTDYVISSVDPDSEYVIDDELVFRGFFAVYAEDDGEHEFVYTNDTELLRTRGSGPPLIQNNQSAFRGTVENFTGELTLENELEIQLGPRPADRDLDEMVGEWIYVEPSAPDSVPDDVEIDDRYDIDARDRRNGVFRIEGVETRQGNRATIDIGEHTPIRRFTTNDPSDGYDYGIEDGAEFVIPISDRI